jgi:hypothetical protein
MQTSRIPFDPTGNNIIVISYPPGGFGHFIYHLLTEFTEETAKPDNSSFSFSNNGNAHRTNKYTVSFLRNHTCYFPQIDRNVDTHNKRILIVADRAFIDNNYQQLNGIFPNAAIVRMTLDPSIYNIVWAMITSKVVGVPVDLRPRGNYPGKGMFEPLDQSNVVNVSIKAFMLDPIATFTELANNLGLTVIKQNELVTLIDEWRKIHKPYFIELYKEYQIEYLL